MLAVFLPPGHAMSRKPELQAEADASVSRAATSTPEKLTLQEAYALALRRSEDLAIRKVDIDQSWADFMQASGEFIGDMNFEMLHSRQKDTGAGGDGATGNALRNTRRARQFTYSQPLFQGFKSLGAFGGAGNLRQQKVQERIRAEHLLFLDVASSFYALDRLKRGSDITRETVRLFQIRVRELTEWEKIGKSRVSEIATARARMKGLEAELARQTGAYAVEKHVLAFLTGISLNGVEPAADESGSPGLLNVVAAVAGVEDRPDVRAASEAYAVTRGNLVVAQSELWPAISLDGNMYEKREGFQSDIDWDILLTVDVPVYKGGETFSKITNAIMDRRKAKLTYEKTVRGAESEIKQKYDAWRSSEEELRALEEAVQASEENYRLQREDYEKNLVDNLDVLAALETLNDDRLESNRALYESRVNYWTFRVASGDCCESV